MALRRDCLRIPLTVLGQGLEIDKQDVTLDQVYIQLNVLRRDHEALRRSEETIPSEKEPQPLLALEAIRDATQVVLLGDPGSGKSSFVKNLLAAIAASELEGAEPLLPDTNGLLPVLIVLRDLAPHLTTTEPDPEKRLDILADLVVEQAVESARSLKTADFGEGVRQAFVEERVFLAADLPLLETIDLLSDEAYLGHESLAAEFLDYVDRRSGLLMGRGGTDRRPQGFLLRAAGSSYS